MNKFLSAIFFVFCSIFVKSQLNYFQNFPEFEIIATFNNSIEALDFLNNNTVDALFLDINMPLMSGFELIQLYKNKSNTKIIITTAFREFAAESYDLDVLDYLVKPIPLPRFIKCISKITGEFQNRMVSKQDNHRVEPHIFIKVDKKMVKINIDEILFIEGMKEYIKVVTPEKTYIMHKILQELTDSYSQDKYGWALICAGFIKNIRQAKRLPDAINTQYNQNERV
jgi:DNA-binding LytR/AlgR family response regulator